MEYVASQSYLFSRQFERKCRDRVSVPPKVFARIIRFSDAYKYKEENQELRNR